MNELRAYSYRKRSPIGGLAANIVATAEATATPPSGAICIARGFWLLVPVDLYWVDLAWLMFGASLRAQEVLAHEPGGVCVRIQKFVYPLADYRVEVAALTIDGWLREEFGLAEIDIGVEFSETTQDYVFEWGPRRPFSDD